jgi:hypothetical protein
VLFFIANVTYGTIEKSASFIADTNPHITVETVDIGPPYTLDGIFSAFEAVFHKVQSSPEYIALTEQGERPKIVVIVGPTELPQMAVRKTRMCSSLCPTKVPPQTSPYHSGSSSGDGGNPRPNSISQHWARSVSRGWGSVRVLMRLFRCT